MKKLLENRFVILLARLVLGVVFILASVDKIASPEAFAVSVDAYRLLPFPTVNIFALLVPWLELLCGVLLLAGYMVRGSSLIATILLCLFTFALLSAMARQLNIDCGCFGGTYRTPVSWTRVGEDLGLLVLALYVYIFSSRELAQNAPATASGPIGSPL
ncbi:MAG: hypothetical protein AUI33_02535 [Ignavibacteria bacterium 13_1_40CM_2_61_4]|nr:MAG: hypothetical protein AUI33_02535 [Ignavibacteria bacterium 13_1_40CM_2_61_4]